MVEMVEILPHGRQGPVNIMTADVLVMPGAESSSAT